MKKIIIIPLLILCVFLSGSYYDEQIDVQLSEAEKSGFSDTLPEYANELLEKIGIEKLDANNLSNINFNDIITLIFESISAKINEPLKAVVSVTAAGIVCSVVSILFGESGKNSSIISAVASLSAASVFLIPIKELVASTSETIGECSDFMLAFIPVYSSSLAATGYLSSAAGYRTMMFGTVTAISQIASEIISPLMLVYLAICISGSVSGIDTEELSKSVKNFAVWIIGTIMAVFSGVMGINTLISSGTDGALSKTAKFIVGSVVPIVGSTVSDAISTVKSCLIITKNFLGIYAILAIAAIFLPILMGLFIWKICINISSFITKIIGNKELSSLLTSVSAVLGIMLSLVIIIGIMFIFSVAIILMTGGGL